MIRATGIALAILFASTLVVLAQGDATPSASQGAPRPQVLSQTGTMYDGNNTDLRLPPEPNKYWVDLWAAPISTRGIGPASGTGSASGAQGEGQD